ncbi:MAG: hypothetical protein LBL09_00515 [Oscillospiraceae bacterium]|jgi:hypothetical protein|nr:hypothetical protein [Oscillospiraceae bacterium]
MKQERQIILNVKGEFLDKSSKDAGVQGEGNATGIIITFDESWEAYTKRLVWHDAKGERPVAVLLSPELLIYPLTYKSAIPGEALTSPGWCSVTVEGFSPGEPNVIQRSVKEFFEVKANYDAFTPAEPTPSQAQQLQYQIDSFENHMEESALKSEGEHGLRFYDNCLWVKKDGEWLSILTTGGGGTVPGNVRDISLTTGDGTVHIKYGDPDDSNWFGTRVVRKLGSYPDGIGDGVVVIDSNSRDAYRDLPFIDSGVVPGTSYYYHFYTYSAAEAVNGNNINRMSCIPREYAVYGVRIDTANPDPLLALTYTDDAVGFLPGGSEWYQRPIYKDIKPCIVSGGQVECYLDRSNFAKDAAGNTVSLTTTGKDVMVEFPKIGYKITRNGSFIDVKVTNHPSAAEDGFCYYAHTRFTEGDRDKLYLGAYLGNYVTSGGFAGLHSNSGATVFSSASIANYRLYAQANGAGFDIMSYYAHVLLQCLYIIMNKSLSAQAATGSGRTNTTAKNTTGATNAKGMDYGESGVTAQCKALGLEDLWGNMSAILDGMYVDGSYNLYTAFRGFNNTGIGYYNRGKIADVSGSGYISKMLASNELGFVPCEFNGSATTYFSDTAAIAPASHFVSGGAYDSGTGSGMFFMENKAESAVTNQAARLMLL